MFFIFGNIFDACLEMVWRFEERTFYIGSLRCHWLRSKTYHIYLIPLWKLSLAFETMEIHLILHLGQHMISSRRTGSHSRRCLNTEVITFLSFSIFFLPLNFMPNLCCRIFYTQSPIFCKWCNLVGGANSYSYSLQSNR